MRSPSKPLKRGWPRHSWFLQTGSVTGVNSVGPVHVFCFQVFLRVWKSSQSHSVILPRSEEGVVVVVLRERRLGLLPPQMFWSINISTVAVEAATSGNQARGWYFPAHSIHRPGSCREAAQVPKVREKWQNFTESQIGVRSALNR